jgi:hypothetical protein
VGPPRSGWQRKSFFSSVLVNLGGLLYSFNDLENGLLRGNSRPPYSFTQPFGSGGGDSGHGGGESGGHSGGHSGGGGGGGSGEEAYQQSGMAGSHQQRIQPAPAGHRIDPRLRGVLFAEAGKREPRIHFALNCGATACPPIKVYSAEAVFEELRISALVRAAHRRASALGSRAASAAELP